MTAVARDDEPVAEPKVNRIVKFSPRYANAAEQEGAEGMIKAIRLVNAETYSIADIIRAQQTDMVTLALKQCFEHGNLDGAPWKCKEKRDGGCLLDPEVRKIVNDFYMQWKRELYVNSQGILCCRRKPDEHDAIVLPQLFHAEVIFRAYDDQGHQGMDKVIAGIKQRSIWLGLNSSVKKWITACRVCQNTKSPPGAQRFPLKNIVSGGFNEIVQIDHQKICQTKSGNTGILVMIDHFTKFVEVAPCKEYTAEETCDILFNVWIFQHSSSRKLVFSLLLT